MRLNGRRSAAAALAVGLVLLGQPAHASPWSVSGPADTGASVDPEAVAAFEEGSNAYALGNYEQAVEHFERAFRLSGRSELLFNLGQAYSRWYEISGELAHLRKGRKLLQNYISYLDQHPDVADDESRGQASQRLEEVDGLIAAHESGSGTNGETDARKPVHKRAWFWVVLVGGAALIAGGVTAAVLLSRRERDDGFDPELGTVGRGSAPAGLGFHF